MYAYRVLYSRNRTALGVLCSPSLTLWPSLEVRDAQGTELPCVSSLVPAPQPYLRGFKVQFSKTPYRAAGNFLHRHLSIGYLAW